MATNAYELPNRKDDLIKHALARQLREEIVAGTLRPQERIVEGTWARRFGVAQSSIREAINILAQEGFVTKQSGRSARVVSLSEQDVLHLYELRGALEGLAARLAAERGADISRLEEAVAQMREASLAERSADLLDADCRFHLELCHLSANPYVIEHAKKVLLPFFAFVRIQVIANGENISPWGSNLEAHQRIIDLIREREGEVASQYVCRILARFSVTAYQSWRQKPPTSDKSPLLH